MRAEIRLQVVGDLDLVDQHGNDLQIAVVELPHLGEAQLLLDPRRSNGRNREDAAEMRRRADAVVDALEDVRTDAEVLVVLPDIESEVDQRRRQRIDERLVVVRVGDKHAASGGHHDGPNRSTAPRGFSICPGVQRNGMVLTAAALASAAIAIAHAANRMMRLRTIRYRFATVSSS